MDPDRSMDVLVHEFGKLLEIPGGNVWWPGPQALAVMETSGRLFGSRLILRLIPNLVGGLVAIIFLFSQKYWVAFIIPIDEL